jgi:hypothetical protein
MVSSTFRPQYSSFLQMDLVKIIPSLLGEANLEALEPPLVRN